MAEKMATVPAVEAEVEVAPKKKKGLLIIIAVLAALAVVGGGVAWYIHSTPSASKEGKHEEEGRGGSGLVPVYEKLDTFTVNLEGGDEHYLQAEISLKLAEADVGEQIKARMPEIRDRVVRILSAKNPDALTSVAGKDALAKELLENLNKLLGAGEGKKGVQAVLFTSFIIQ